MAFVTLATTTSTGLTALSSYFLPIDSTQYSTPYSLVNFISGSDYYVEGNQYTSNNELKINNASSKLNNVRLIIGGGANPYSNFFSWATGDAKATTINFSLFPNLSSLSFEGNDKVNTMDLRGLPMKSIGMWAAGPLSAFYITNIQWLVDGAGYGGIDMRQSSLSTVNISGCRILRLNLSDNQLSAFDFKLGDDNKNASVSYFSIGRNPFKNLTINFNNCDTRLLSTVQEFKFSKWNNFSQGAFNGTEENYKLKSITIGGPLSSLVSLDVSQNNLSSLYVPFIPTLKNLFIGQYARQFETSNDVPQRTLSANRVELNSLTALQYFHMGGIGPISGLNSITGMDRLSSLVYLYVDNNPTLNGVSIKDLDLSIIPGKNLQWVSATQNPSITGINFGNQTFERKSISNPYVPEYRSPTLNLENCTSISALDISALSGLYDLYYPGATELRTLTLPLTSDAIAAVTVANATYLTDLTIPTLLSYYLRVQYCPALTGLVLDHNYRIGVINVTDVPSNLEFTGCSGLNSIYINNTDTINMDFSELSACREIICYNNQYLNNINFPPSLNTLETIDLANNYLLSSVDIESYTYLTDVKVFNSYTSTINIKNNTRLFNISIYDPINSLLPLIDCSNNFNLRGFTYGSDNVLGGLASSVSGINFSNCYLLSSITLEGANLRNLDSIIPVTNLKSLTLESLPLSSLDALNYIPSLTAVSISNSWGVTSPLPLVNLDSYNNPLNIHSASINYIYTLTSADTFIRNLSPKCRNLTLLDNDLNTLDTTPFSGLNLRYIDIRNNQLSSQQIDSLLIALDNNPVNPSGIKYLYYNNNATNRSRVSNATRTSLVIKGWFGTSAIASKAVPDLYIDPVPQALQISKTTNILSTASYLGSSVPTYVTVLSGPGVITGSGTTLSAIDSTGTITIAVCSRDTFYYQPVYTIYHIQAVRYDVSPLISFTGLNKIYTSNVVEASASVPTYSLSAQLSYYQDGVSTTPLAPGYYTVSAVVSEKDYYGTAINTLSVINVDDFYTIPASATSSFIYFPKNCDTTKDIVVTFDYAFYGQAEQGEEGFCVAFTDTSTYKVPITGGGPGKALNYTNLTLLTAVDDTFITKSFAGRFKGWLGVGFDVSGNFALTGISLPGYSNKVPNSICIRDSYLSAYNTLYRTESLASTAFKTPVTLYQSTTGIPEYTSVRVRLANLGKKVIVDMKPLSSVKYENYLQYDLPKSLPGITNVSLGYSSGKTTPTFKIKNFNLNYFDKEYIVSPYDLFSHYFNGPGEYGENGVTYTSFYDYSFFYNAETPIGIPYSMDIFVRGIFLANVLFDPIYLNKDFAIQNDINGQATYSTFITGNNYL